MTPHPQPIQISTNPTSTHPEAQFHQNQKKNTAISPSPCSAAVRYNAKASVGANPAAPALLKAAQNSWGLTCPSPSLRNSGGITPESPHVRFGGSRQLGRNFKNVEIFNFKGQGGKDGLESCSSHSGFLDSKCSLDFTYMWDKRGTYGKEFRNLNTAR